MTRQLFIGLLFFSFISVKGQLTVSHSSGFYEQAILLELRPDDPDAVVYYTLNGSEPDSTAFKYSSPILLDVVTTENGLSHIRTGENWIRPEYPVIKGHTLRVAVYKHHQLIDPLQTFSYFIRPDHRARFPVDRLALTVDSVDFFSASSGIYVPGDNEIFNFHQTGDDWERPVFAELFDDSGASEWSQSLGARIHGRSSRTNPQKSLRLYAKDKYGSPFIFYPVFGTEGPTAQKRILLRAPDRLFSKAMFTDAVVHQTLLPLTIDQMDTRTVAVFINGEYWGIQSLRERLDEQYLRIRYGIDPDKVDIIDWDREADASKGTIDEFQKLMTFLSFTDLSSDEGYTELGKRVDMDAFIPFIAAHLFFANEDFPNNNVRMWRERSFGKKWHFFFYDCDGCMRNVEMDPFERFMFERNDGNPVSLMLSGLMKNADFRHRLLEYLSARLTQEFSPSSLIRQIDRFEQTYAPLMPDHIRRWNAPDGIQEWSAAVGQLRSFALSRASVMGNLLEEYLGKPYKIYPVPVKNELSLHFSIDPGTVRPGIQIFDLRGKSFHPEFQFSGNGKVMAPVDELPSGMYVVEVTLGTAVFRERIIINH